MISVTILTKNSERYLREVLASVQDFDEVIVADTGSTDTTLSIVGEFPRVILHHLPFQGFGPTHNAVSALARNDWLLSLDSDEVMSAELAHEILALQLDEKAVYSFWRKNFYRGKHIRGCGWFPDRVIRLYNRQYTQFSKDQVHEKVERKNLRHIPLSAPVFHFPYASVSMFLKKMDSYTDLYAEQNKGQKGSIWQGFFHGLFAFFKTYILKRGFLLGSEGFEIAWYNMNCTFYKRAKLAEKRACKMRLCPEEKGSAFNCSCGIHSPSGQEKGAEE